MFPGRLPRLIATAMLLLLAGCVTIKAPERISINGREWRRDGADDRRHHQRDRRHDHNVGDRDQDRNLDDDNDDDDDDNRYHD